MENSDIKIIFHIEDIDLDNDMPIPCCVIFYTKNKCLYHLKTMVSASVLNNNGCFTVFSFLEKNQNYLTNLLIENNHRTTTEFVEEYIKNKEIFKSGKNKLLTILRKQKINNLLQ